MEEQIDAPAEPATPLTLEERVAFLEAQNEGLKRVGMLGLVLVLLLGAILVHQTYSDLRSSTTRGLTLLTDKDELGGALTIDPKGRMQFLQAVDGMMTQTTDLPPDFKGFAFYDSGGTARILMGENLQTHETIFWVIDPTRGLAFDAFEKFAKKRPSMTPAPGASPLPSASPLPPAASPRPPVSPTP